VNIRTETVPDSIQPSAITNGAPGLPALASASLPAAILASKPASNFSPCAWVPVAWASRVTVRRMYPIGSLPSEPRSATTGTCAAICAMTFSGTSVVVTTRSGSSAMIASRLGSPRVPTSAVAASIGAAFTQTL
jgi:hypothetical protein